jgi:hypothetical protein
VERLHVDRRLRPFTVGAERVGGVRDELASPFGDLIRVHIEALRELGERGGAFDRGQSQLGFERR